MNNHTAKHVNVVFENLVTCVCEDMQGRDETILLLKILTALHEAADTTMAKLQLLVLRATIHLNTKIKGQVVSRRVLSCLSHGRHKTKEKAEACSSGVCDPPLH